MKDSIFKTTINKCGTVTGRFTSPTSNFEDKARIVRAVKKSNYHGTNMYTGKPETLEESLERRKKHKRVERFNAANFTGFPIAIIG